MFRPRVIPVLLLNGSKLVKSVKFKNLRYIGDPLNAVKLFNDLKADELVILDISATKEKRAIPLRLISKIGDEANMPFSVGGGIRSIEFIRELINAGAEKVVINSYAAENPKFIREASDVFGSSTITVSIDVKRSLFGKIRVVTNNGKKYLDKDPISYSKLMEKFGAGEIILNSVNRDGLMTGYNIELIKSISSELKIPVVALGGAGSLNDFKLAVDIGHASAVAAGSMFVYHGSRKAVLINYPSRDLLNKIFDD